MAKASNLRNTDIGLMITFPLTVISGLVLHATTHNLSVIHFKSWLVAHIVAAILFLIFAIKHIYQHWGWFKTFFTNFRKYSKITSITTFFFILVSVTGVILIIEKSKGGLHLSLFHYQLGMLFSIFATWHCLKRLKRFRKLKG